MTTLPETIAVEPALTRSLPAHPGRSRPILLAPMQQDARRLAMHMPPEGGRALIALPPASPRTFEADPPEFLHATSSTPVVGHRGRTIPLTTSHTPTCQGRSAARARRGRTPRHRLQAGVPAHRQDDGVPRPEEGKPPPHLQPLPAQRPGQVRDLWQGHDRSRGQERQVLLLRVPLPTQAWQWHLQDPQAQRQDLREAHRQRDQGERAHRVQHPRPGEAAGRGDGWRGPGAAAEASEHRGGA